MKGLILLITVLFAYNSATAQLTDTIIAKPVTKDGSEGALPLYVLVVRSKLTILDTTYQIDPKVINGIYFCRTGRKLLKGFGERGQNGVFFITTRKEYLERFLKTLGIIYNSKERDPYTRAGSQVYQ